MCEECVERRREWMSEGMKKNVYIQGVPKKRPSEGVNIP